MRSFSGLLVTCSLDHILFMNEERADHFNYGPRKTVSSSLHGRIGTIPGKLIKYGEAWNGDECTLYCEGSVVQATVFGEDLHLLRRIEVKVGTGEIHLRDQVINHGFYRTPHMFCYHINIGYPLPDPQKNFHEQVWEREVLGKPFADERDELIWLEHNEQKNYHTIFRIHEDTGNCKP